MAAHYYLVDIHFAKKFWTCFINRVFFNFVIWKLWKCRKKKNYIVKYINYFHLGCFKSKIFQYTSKNLVFVYGTNILLKFLRIYILHSCFLLCAVQNSKYPMCTLGHISQIPQKLKKIKSEFFIIFVKKNTP